MAKQKIPEVHGEVRFRNPLTEFASVPNSVIFGRFDLSPRAVWLYCCLRAFAFGDKRYCYPTVGGLAKIQEVTERTIQRTLEQLEKTRLITIETQQGYRNIYWIEEVPNTPDTHVRGVTDVGGNVLRKQDSIGLEQNENEQPSFSSHSILNDKTALLESLAAEFAPEEKPQAIVSYLRRFPAALLAQAAQITRDSDNKHKPVAYLYGVVQRLAEQEALKPLAQQRGEVLPALSEEEYQASLQALERVKQQLGAGP